MISEELQDRAVAYVFGLLDEQKMGDFREELARHPELKNLVESLEARMADLALSVEPVDPPSTLWPKIQEEAAGGKARQQRVELQEAASGANESNAANKSWLPWALAACLALACGLLTISHVRLQRQLSSVAKHDEVSQMRIATLVAQVEAYSKVRAVVIWDVSQQRGVVELSKLPPLDAEHDYQLWVIDPSQPGPVSAGVVTVDANGSARVVFHPVISVEAAQTFALSVEAKGGGTSPQGQIVLAGK